MRCCPMADSQLILELMFVCRSEKQPRNHSDQDEPDHVIAETSSS